MPFREQPSFTTPPDPDGSASVTLPKELAAFLKDQEYATLWHATNIGTVLVAKLPNREIASIHGTIPIHLGHTLYEHPQAPVIRSLIQLYDRPDSHVGLETYTNVAEEGQKDDFARLARQETIHLLFYNERLDHSLTKRVKNTKPSHITQLLLEADAIRLRIPHDLYDYDVAKQAVMEVTSL